MEKPAHAEAIYITVPREVKEFLLTLEVVAYQHFEWSAVSSIKIKSS